MTRVKLEPSDHGAVGLGLQFPVMIGGLASAAYGRIETVAMEFEAGVLRRGFAGATVVGLPDIAPKIGIECIPSAG